MNTQTNDNPKRKLRSRWYFVIGMSPSQPVTIPEVFIQMTGMD